MIPIIRCSFWVKCSVTQHFPLVLTHFIFDIFRREKKKKKPNNTAKFKKEGKKNNCSYTTVICTGVVGVRGRNAKRLSVVSSVRSAFRYGVRGDAAYPYIPYRTKASTGPENADSGGKKPPKNVHTFKKKKRAREPRLSREEMQPVCRLIDSWFLLLTLSEPTVSVSTVVAVRFAVRICQSHSVEYFK